MQYSFLENSAINISGNQNGFADAVVLGSKIHDKLAAYNNETNEMFYSIKKFYWPVYSYADSLHNDELKKMLDSLRNDVFEKVKEHTDRTIQSNLNNPFGPYLILRTYFKESQAAQLDSIIRKFPQKISNSIYVLELKSNLAKWQTIGVGKELKLPENNLVDTAGNKFSVSLFKGKYIFIDFWASWCLPCRKQNPELVKLNDRFRSDRFAILSISLDTNRDKWITAIKQDKLAWYHASDLKGWDSEIPRYLGTNALPNNLLIDNTGKIVSKDITIEELSKFIKSLAIENGAN